MPSDLEQLTVNGVALNDQETFSLGALTYTPAEKKLKWAENANANGAALVEEAQYSNAVIEATVCVVPAADTDAALEALGTLTDALQGCERIEGGAEGSWTPNSATTTYDFYTLVGEYVEIPITVDGVEAGWFIASPVVKIRLTNRCFLYTEERQVLAPVESSAPLQIAYVSGIGGDVPAEGRLVLTDKAEQSRRYTEWGLEQLDSEEGNPDLLLEADEDLVVEGYVGELAELAGSHSTEVVKATLVPQPVVLCSTGEIAHVGSYRLKLRCQASGEGALFRASYRVGDGPWTNLPWREPSLLDQWVETDLEEASLDEAEKGEQVSEIRIEGKVEETSCTGYADLLGLMPARRYGVARATLRADTPSVFKAWDGFGHEAGTLTGKTLPVGGEWAEAGDEDGLAVAEEEGGIATRTIIDDGAGFSAGHFAIAGTTSLADSFARVDFRFNTTGGLGGAEPLSGMNQGVFARFTDASNFVVARITEGDGVDVELLCTMEEEGGITTLARTPLSIPVQGAAGEAWYTIALFVTADGHVGVFFGPKGVTPTQRLTAYHSSLVTGGSLASGKFGIYDRYGEGAEGVTITRRYDNFAAWEPDAPVVCESSQSLEFRDDGAQREDSGGTYWSPVPEPRGSDFYLDPEGDGELVNRLAVKMRRNDTKLEPDGDLGDAQSLEVLARERWITPR